MNKNEARELALERLDELRGLSFETLRDLPEQHHERVAPSGTWYELDIDTFWDDRQQTNLRVVVSIDDGGWSAFSPLCVAFIIAPDGSFIDE